MKRLYKSRTNKVIDGVCGGIAEYFDVDPVLIRIVFVLMFFFGGSGLLAYIIGMIIMPASPVATSPKKETKSDKISENTPESAPGASTAGSLIVGIVLILMGGFFLMRDLPFMSDIYWFVKDHFWEYFIPIGFILLGLTLIFKGKR